MRYALFCKGDGSAIKFKSEAEVRLYVRGQGVYSEEITNEELPPRRILDARYEIHHCSAEGELVALQRYRWDDRTAGFKL
jgi:hypothetical protein